MPQDRAVEQCDSLPPSSLALCTISRIKDGTQLLFIQGGSARFKKLKPKGFLRMLLCFHWEQKQLCHTEKPWLLMAPRWTNGFRWSAEPQSSFQMPPLPCWMKPLIIWAKGYNCWDRDNKCFYQLLHLKPLQFFEDLYLQHCCGWCHCSQVHVSSSDWYKDTKIFVLNQVAELL